VARVPTITLVLGGARSGKSAFAQDLARRSARSVLFVATGVATDAEMQGRIAAHRAGRPGEWGCVEAPIDVGAAIRNEGSDAAVVLVDCLSFLVSNLLIATDVERDGSTANLEERIEGEIEQLLDAVTSRRADLIVVSNEVGMSLVPDNRLGRLYRDLLGRANQSMAAVARTVYLMVAGIPLTVKQPDGR